MNKKDIEKNLKGAFEKATPDCFNSILSDCRDKKGIVIDMNETKSKKGFIYKIAAIAAAFVLIVCGTFIGFNVYSNNSVYSVVSLDVNPSIEIKTNKNNKVLDVSALNEDGQKVIGEMDFKGSSLELTVNALIGSMLKNGYLSDIANSILISVDNNDPEKSAELQKQLTEEINALIKANSFDGAVLSQSVSHDKDIETLAENYGITVGKAQLINQIVSQNSLYKFEDLVPLSINELNLLSESGNLKLDNIQSVGSASDKAYVGEQKAKAAAIAKAGVNEADIYKYECELDFDDGLMIYEIEFSCGGYEYDFDINATTGEIIKWNRDNDDDYRAPSGGTTGGSSNNTGSSNTTGSSNNTGNTGGSTGGNTGGSNAAGTSSSSQNSNGGSTGANTGTKYIGEQKAKSAALSHAGVSADNIREYECELDRDDGIVVYEIEFKSGNYEYSYEINATDGKVLKYEKDFDD